MNPNLPPVLDPALACPVLTIVRPDGGAIVDPRTNTPIRFHSVRAAKQQCYVWKLPTARIAPLVVGGSR